MLNAAVALGRIEALRIPPQYDRAWGSMAKFQVDLAIGHPLRAL